MHLKLRAHLLSDDFAAAEQLNASHRTEQIFFVVVTVFLLGGLAFSPERSSPDAWAGLVLSLLVLGWAVRRASRRGSAARSGKQFILHKTISTPYEVDLTDDAMVTRSAQREETKIPWNEFCKWQASPELILVYSSSEFYDIFPRRWFATDADYAAFQELLARTIGPAGQMRKIAP